MKELNYTQLTEENRIAFQIIREAIESLEAQDTATAALISALQTGKANISRGTGAPSGGNDMDLYIDDSANRLYVNVNGTWKYTALT